MKRNRIRTFTMFAVILILIYWLTEPVIAWNVMWAFVAGYYFGATD